VDNSSNTCAPTPQYSVYLSQLYSDNYPYFPPFCFFGLLIAAAALLAYFTSKTYKYTYHFGYLIALSSIIELIFLVYGFSYIIRLYQGDYTKQNKLTPIYIVAGSFAFKLMISFLFVVIVLGQYYLKDIRFKEWKQQY
jgi:hypothetical protein